MTPRKTLAIAAIAALVALPPAADAGNHKGDKHHGKCTATCDASCVGHHGAWLGVMLQEVKGNLAEALEHDADVGVLVSQVVEESPADEAGLESGDIVLRVDEDEVALPSELQKLIRKRDAGDRVTIEILRDGDEKKVEVLLGVAPKSPGLFGRSFEKVRRHFDRAKDLRFAGERGFLGVETQELRGELGEYFGVDDGALVTKVVEDSPAEKLGLEAGDVIVKVNDEDIESPSDLRLTVGGYEEETEVEVVWMRDKREKSGRVTLEVREGRGLFGPDEDHVRMYRHPGGRIRIEEFELEKEGVSDMLDELREELDELREELDELKTDKN